MPSVSSVSLATSRIFSVDAARGFAIFAMLVAHTIRFVEPFVPKALITVEWVLNDVAAPLFAIVIGVTFTISGPAPTSGSRERRVFRTQTFIRAVLIILLSLALILRFSGVNIVLAYLGVAMILALPFLFLNPRTLLWVSAMLLVLMPVIVMAARSVFGTTVYTLAEPLQSLADWVVFGYSYQAINFLPLILFGVFLGRAKMRDRTAMLFMALAGLLTYVVLRVLRIFAPEWTTVRGGLTETLPECTLAIGTFALLVFLSDHAGYRVQRIARSAFSPLTAMGRMALSVYVFHVLILMAVWAVLASDPQSLLAQGKGSATLVQPALILICWAFAALWWRYWGTGPIERIFGLISGRRRGVRTMSRLNEKKQ